MSDPNHPPDEPRDLALWSLYEADQRNLEEPVIDAALPPKAARLVRGVLAHRSELDTAIDEVSDRWRVGRMPPVDRAILRLGLYELRYEADTPVGVILSEAVRLANAYSTERSGGFVNGILGKLAEVERRSDDPRW